MFRLARNFVTVSDLTNCLLKCRIRPLSVQAIATKPLVPQVSILQNHWIYKENNKIQTPLPKINIIELPNGLKYVPDAIEPVTSKVIESPANSSNTPKYAERLIVIRRKKMKKHKLKKLRKRMKYEWAKIRQRRELKKEKIFQAGLIQQCKEAEAFSAEKYVDEKIAKLNEIIIPRYWKGRRLPEFIIREKMGLPPK